jgi:hypothetical protein
MAESLETYVPQTGSLWSVPPARTTGGVGELRAGGAERRKPAKKLRRIERRNRKNSRGRRNSRMKAENMWSGPDRAIQPLIV